MSEGGQQTPEPDAAARSRRSGLARWWATVGELIVAWTLLAVGVVLLVLPGPGLLLIAIGLSLLAKHHHWARRILARVRRMRWRKQR